MTWFNVADRIEDIHDPRWVDRIDEACSAWAAESAAEQIYSDSAGECAHEFEVFVIEDGIQGPAEAFEITIEFDPSFSAAHPWVPK